MALSLHIMLWNSVFHCYVSYNTSRMPIYHFTQILWNTQYGVNSNFAFCSILKFKKKIFWFILFTEDALLSSCGSYYVKIKQPALQAVQCHILGEKTGFQKRRHPQAVSLCSWSIYMYFFSLKCHCFLGAVLHISYFLFPCVILSLLIL